MLMEENGKKNSTWPFKVQALKLTWHFILQVGAVTRLSSFNFSMKFTGNIYYVTYCPENNINEMMQQILIPFPNTNVILFEYGEKQIS